MSLDPNAADGAIDLLTGKQCDFIFYEEDRECSEEPTKLARQKQS